MVKIVPVIDLMAGQVVRGVGGRRHEYQRVTSVLAADAQPATIAQAFADLGLPEVYVADLDAIGGAEPAWDVYEQMSGCGLRLWIDAGLTDLERTRRLAQFQPHNLPWAGIVAGLESLASIELLRAMYDLVGSERLIFSLDLKAGQPLTSAAAWQRMTAEEIGAAALEIGIRRIIVLDLAQVGLGQGVGTAPLCRSLRARGPQAEIIAGGGVRSVADIEALAAAGCDAVLVASALHDGRIGRREILDCGFSILD